MTISNRMTVIALVNGMIGGIILVMPIMALNTGYLLIAPLAIILGFFSYFSCLLCIRHLKNYSDLDEAVLKHFGDNRRYKILYDIIIVISMTVLLILYFNLICEQWESMTAKSRLIPILNAIVLFPIVYIMKKFDFGASLLGYGILSIVGYCIFLAWMWITAPQGQKRVEAASPHFIQLAAALAQGFAIQTFFIPVLKKNINKHLYKRLLGITYTAGILVYSYIGYAGAFSIINRELMGKIPETIQDYFDDKNWQVTTLQIIYLVHLYSAFPQFLLVAKKRFFSIIHIAESNDVSINQTIYVSVTILLGLIIKLTNISVDVIIEINGGIISFFFIYVIPIGLHLKCVYFSGTKHTKMQEQEIGKEIEIDHQKQSENKITENKMQQQDQRQIKKINEDKIFVLNNQKIITINENEQPFQIQEKINQHAIRAASEKERRDNVGSQDAFDKQNQYEMGITNRFDMIRSSIVDDNSSRKQQKQCICDVQFSSKAQQIGQIIVMICMIFSGVFVMGYTIYSLANPEVKNN